MEDEDDGVEFEYIAVRQRNAILLGSGCGMGMWNGAFLSGGVTRIASSLQDVIPIFHEFTLPFGGSDVNAPETPSVSCVFFFISVIYKRSCLLQIC